MHFLPAFRSLWIMLFLWVSYLSAQAQNNITSLKKQLTLARADTSHSRILYTLGKEYTEVNLDSSLYFLNQSLRVAQQSRDQSAMAKAMHRIGFMYLYYVNDDAKALEWFNKGIVVARKGNDNLNLARCYQCIAIIAYNQHIGNPDEILDRALSYAKKANDWQVLLEVYSIMQGFSIKLKNFKRAKRAALLAMEACQKYSIDEWFSHGLDYCDALVSLGEQDKAQLFCQKLNALKHTLTMSKGYFVYMNDRARLETKLKNYTGAKGILLSVLAVEKAKPKPDTFHLYHVYRHLLDLYRNQGDYKKALALSTDLTDVRLWLQEKRRTQDSKVRMTQIKAALDIEKKEAELTVLATQKQQQQIYLIAAIIIAVLLLGFLFVLQRNRQRIDRQRAQLSQLNATKDKLFAILSHDLRSPVGSLRNYLMLIDWGALSKEEFAESAQDLTDQLNSVHTMLENVLNWSVSQMGGLHPKFELLHVSPIIEEQIQVLLPAAHAKNIQIINQIPAEAQLLADKNHLSVIIRNLLQNALKFTRSGGMVYFTYTEMPGIHTIVVQDTGIGMETGKLARLFQIGKSSSRIGTAHEQGTGLGLVLVDELVRANHGQIQVISEQDKGTTFTLTFTQKADALPESAQTTVIYA